MEDFDFTEILLLLSLTSDTGGLNWKGLVIWILLIVVISLCISFL